MWATAPFLHNGSVPSIYQLLSPQDERATTFYKGTFDYDPRHLGYRTEAFTNAFLFDTRLTVTTKAATNSAPVSVATA